MQRCLQIDNKICKNNHQKDRYHKITYYLNKMAAIETQRR